METVACTTERQGRGFSTFPLTEISSGHLSSLLVSEITIFPPLKYGDNLQSILPVRELQ